MALAALSIDLTAKVAQFETDLRKAATASEKVSADMRAAFGTVSAAIGGITGALSVGFVTQLVTASIDAVDALNDVSDATGASVENISALQDVAARTGTEFAAVETALLKLNSVLSDATPGSKQAAILSSIGLSADELRKLDPAEAVLEVSKALAGYADDGDKARLVQELFGKSAKDVAAFMKDLAEQGKLVASVTTEQTQEAEKFNKALAVLKSNAADVTRTISIDLITSLNDLAKAFKDGEEAGKGFFEIVNSRYWENVSKVYGNAGDSADGYRKRLTEIDQQLSGGESRLLVRNALLREQAELQAKLAATPVTAATDQTGAEDARLGRSKPKVGGLPKDTKEPKATTSRGLSEAQRAEKELREYVLKIQRQTATEAGNLVQAGIEANERWVADIQRSAQAATDARTAAAVQDLSAMAQSNEALALQVQEIGLTTEQLGALKLARMDEAIATREATLATAAANGLSYEEISALEQKIELLKKQRELTASGQIAQAAADTRTEQEAASKEFASTLRNDVKGALGAALRDTEGEPLKALGDAVFNVIFSRSATALADSLAGSALSIAGFPTASAGGFDNLFAVLPSFDGGGITGGGARAGGIDGKGGFLSILHPNETVLDHTKGQRTGQQAQPVTVIQNFTVGDVATVSMVRQAVAGSERRIAGAMGRSMSYGGALG